MWTDNEIYLDDLKKIIKDPNINWEDFKNKTFFITGATGLIGNLIVNTLLYLNKIKGLDIKIIALVRNKEKTNRLYEKQISEGLNIEFIYADIQKDIDYNGTIDYIIHSASQTSSKEFVENPTGTINIILNGTKNMLELARKTNTKKFIFLSTMEVYGRPTTDDKINEMHSTNLNTTSVRDCYPIAKYMAENLCVCYANQYNFDSKILRLTQTFGPGVKYNDGRVFAEFARCAIENRDIILHTAGETKRNYLYTADAVRAIFTVLLKGNKNEIYNAANEETYCSILEMAQLVANECTNKLRQRLVMFVVYRA